MKKTIYQHYTVTKKEEGVITKTKKRAYAELSITEGRAGYVIYIGNFDKGIVRLSVVPPYRPLFCPLDGMTIKAEDATAIARLIEKCANELTKRSKAKK